jgi:CHASE3 domain sensor protein
MVFTKSLKRLLIIALVAMTIVWSVALYLHIQGYNRYMQGVIESFMVWFDTDEAGARRFVEGYWDGPTIGVGGLVQS